MKYSMVAKAILGLASATQIIGCGAKNQATSTVSSGFSMTASTKPAAVASYNGTGLLGILIPNANALVPTNVVDSSGLPMSFSSAWISIKEIEFEAAEIKGAAEVPGSEISFKGPYFIDLLSNSPLNLDTQLVPAAAYHRIKIQLHTSGGTLPAGAPAALSANSLILQAVVGTRNFELRLNDGTEMNVGGPKAIVPAANSHILVEINFASIFKQIDMSTVAASEIISATNKHATTCPLIDPSSTDVYNCVRKALEKMANFGEDDNFDGVLSSNEAAVK